MGLVRHILPADSDCGDTTWFARQNGFEQGEIRRQVAFKRLRWPHLDDGPAAKHPDHTYPHILPAGAERLALHPSFVDEAFSYLRDAEIALHSEALNLKSSQVACLNFLFPLRLDRRLATRVFRQLLPDLAEVTGLEFEYTGQDETKQPLPCTEWLGEPPSGKRGQNRTSIDAALFWRDTIGAEHITLIEWKYTERNFGVCSAYEQGEPESRQRCAALDVLRNPEASCGLVGGGPARRRRYWEHLASAGVVVPRLAAVSGCPFRGPFYQLMRQFLVAQFLRMQPDAPRVDVVALGFVGNKALGSVPDHLVPLKPQQDASLVETWSAVLASGVAPLRHVAAEELVAAIDAVPSGEVDPAWREYLRSRYGL